MNENVVALYEQLQEAAAAQGLIGAMASLGDAEITRNCYEVASRLAEQYTHEGVHRVPTTEWREYLAAVDVNDNRTPGERLAEYFS